MLVGAVAFPVIPHTDEIWVWAAAGVTSTNADNVSPVVAPIVLALIGAGIS